ncbi:hypothetical protein [Persephonella sp.]
MEHMDDLKRVILPHRAYRVISGSKEKILLDIAVLVFLLGAFIYFSEPVVSTVVDISYSVLDDMYSGLEVHNHGFGLWSFKHLSTYGKYPSELFSTVVLIVSILSGFMFLKINRLKNVFLFLAFVSFMVGVSSLYFMFFIEEFPYSLETFLQIYIDVVFIAWISTALILLLSISPFPTSLFQKILFFTLFLLVSVGVGIVRYMFVVVVLKEFTYIFAPILFFVFGPLIDLIYMVFIFGVFVSLVTYKKSKDIRVWKWVGW